VLACVNKLVVRLTGINMNHRYSKLMQNILTSSIWMEDNSTRLVWITLLALKDDKGEVAAALPGLANAARVSLQECEVAISKLESPDKYSRTTEHEGRRIEKIDGGWRILNHDKYRNSQQKENRREYMRNFMAEKRRREREEKKEVPYKDEPVCNSLNEERNTINSVKEHFKKKKC